MKTKINLSGKEKEWIQEALSGIEAPEMKHQYEEKLIQEINTLSDECNKDLSENELEDYILQHLGKASEYAIKLQKELNEEKKRQRIRTKHQERIAGLVFLVISGLFFLRFFMYNIAKMDSMQTNLTFNGRPMGDLVGATLAGATIWLVLGILFLWDSRK